MRSRMCVGVCEHAYVCVWMGGCICGYHCTYVLGVSVGVLGVNVDVHRCRVKVGVHMCNM